MRIAVAIAFAKRQEVIEVDLAEGASVADAIAAAGLQQRFPGLDLAAVRFGIWSRVAKPSAKLREGDRVEVYRGLRADPKDMRRERAKLKPSTRSRSGP
jgi:uncharacterized protein